MAEFLLELFSEEIPARMQVQAARDLERLMVGALSDRGMLFEAIRSLSGPRRLVLVIEGLASQQPDLREEKKGPRVGAPQKAIDGFLRSAGVSLDECLIQRDAKGEFYVAIIERKGRSTLEVLADIVPEVMGKLPWPKSMRWGTSGSARWVRPLHGILALFDAEVVPCTFAGVKSSNVTYGHRFLSEHRPIVVHRYGDYEAALKAAYVVLDPEERKEIISHELKQRSFALGLEPIDDEGLLNEVAGLVEWPVVHLGLIEDAFMTVPPEILQTSMRTHQKYFALREPGTGRMAPRFAVVANMRAVDDGKQIIAGNERVLRARLSDAKFFWDQDRKIRLADRVGALRNIVFHAKLGTQYARVERIEALAALISEKIGADVAKAQRAARLCKADLTTGVVGEFPELQGVMGRYYALHDGEDVDVADAIRDHYRPIGPQDVAPVAPLSVAVALADKIDSLVAFFLNGERPTGSGDPYALRRAALGIIRIILDSRARLPLLEIFTRAQELIAPAHGPEGDKDAATSVLSFLAERLKVSWREKGTRHDLIDAVLSLGDEDDLVRLVARVDALQNLLSSEDGANLLIAYRRAANILRAEEKKDGCSYAGIPDPQAFVQPEEEGLFIDLATAGELIAAEIGRERFIEAMAVMARLRGPVDAFFDKVTVNADDPALRRNRLLLLSRLRSTLHLVADFSRIEG
ncbi:MAG: glycine--tRNA ligase subunit beta [Alphaproteobacteria bacterium]|nr:glycine--tRNA ligase subunit beta [Alphaproteobacteria bacterium]